MKKIIKYIALGMFVLGMTTSCNDDFLEEAGPVGRFTNDVFQSEDQTSNLIGNIYYSFFHGYDSPVKTLIGNWTDTKQRMTEERGGSINDYIRNGSALVNAENASNYYGTRLGSSVANDPYTRIRYCNLIIQNIDEFGAGTLDEDFMNHAKGQMYYLRGLQYFELMRVYGGVPIVLDVQNASSSDESIQLPRASTAEVIDQIVADFDEAASLLPVQWPASDFGRPVASAALAQKARALLTYASPLFNPQWDTDNSRWQTALDAGLAAETALTNAGFGLYGSSAHDWAEMFLVDNTFCSEAIAVRLLGLGTGTNTINSVWENSIRPTSQSGGGGVSVPKEMIDLFPMQDGSRPTEANGYNDFLFFKDRDPRFYRTFAFNGSVWPYLDHSDEAVWVYTWMNGTNRAYSDNNQNNSPVLVRKMSNPELASEEFAYSGTDVFEYRYAELILNIAECYAALGQTENALTYLERIRERVYDQDPGNNYGLGNFSGKYDALEACLYERRVELAYEGKRFWDIQRWMLYNDDPAAGNTTCAQLGIAPINGTARRGFYLEFNNTSSATDPLESVRPAEGVDADSENFEQQIEALESFYTDNLEVVETDSPMDNLNGEENLIDWQQNYYIEGLGDAILRQNPWLEQTIGWRDAYGSEGTFDYRN